MSSRPRGTWWPTRSAATRSRCAGCSAPSPWRRCRWSGSATPPRSPRRSRSSPTRAGSFTRSWPLRMTTRRRLRTRTTSPPSRYPGVLAAVSPRPSRLGSAWTSRRRVRVATQASAEGAGAPAPAGAPGNRGAAALEAPPPAVVVSGLTKSYGDIEAVRGIDFEVAAGETFGFLGPNGAGKSTTIKILCTLARPTTGRASVAGHDVVSERDAVRRNIGLVFQDTTLDNYLTGAQNLRFHAALYGVPAAAVAPRMRQVLEMVDLWDRRDSLVMTYSGGMQRRLEIARGLLHAPHVLFLDEPTVGLDPQTRSSIWEYINDLKTREDITIFLTTHYMDEAEHCDRIAIIDHGKIVAIDTPEALKASVGKARVQIHTENDAAAIDELA